VFQPRPFYREGVGTRVCFGMRRPPANESLPYELSLSDKDRSGVVSNIGIKERRVGTVTILSADGEIRIGLRFGGSSVSLPSAVASIDARGLGELVSSYMVVTRSGGQFKLLNLTHTLRELMMTTKLQTVFDVYESESQAVASFAGDTLASAEAASCGPSTSNQNANSLKDQ
jgi:anti-sigma B factor antagonist